MPSIPVTAKTISYDRNTPDGKIDESEFQLMEVDVATRSIIDSFQSKEDSDIPKRRMEDAYALIQSHPARHEIGLALVSKVYFDLIDQGLCEKIQEDLTFDYPKNISWPREFGETGDSFESVTVKLWKEGPKNSSYVFRFNRADGTHQSVLVYVDDRHGKISLRENARTLKDFDTSYHLDLHAWLDHLISFLREQIFTSI